MTTQTPEAPGAPAGTEGTPPAADASTAPDASQNSPAGYDGGSTGSTEPAGQQPADSDTPAVIRALRDDFKAERTKRQQAEQSFTEFRTQAEQREQARQQAETERNRKLAIALGVASEDEPPDPAKLAEELERTRENHKAELGRQAAEIRQRDLRLAVLTQAPAMEANGALLMDSLSFLRKLDGLDPAAGDFSERVGEAIRAAAQANPQYQLKPPALEKPAPTIPRSGGEHNGAPGGNRQWTLEDVNAASPQEVTQAIEQGLLVDLGYNPAKKKRN